METSIGEELFDLAENIQEEHPLTKYIVEIDNNIGDDTILRAIGERIGIYIPENEDAVFILYTELKKYLKNKTDPNITREKIKMTLEQYQKQLKDPNISEDNLYLLYYNRLLQ